MCKHLASVLAAVVIAAVVMAALPLIAIAAAAEAESTPDPPPTGAGGYPVRAITLLLPFPPGGSTGYTAQVLADGLEKLLGRPVVLTVEPGDFGIDALRSLIGKTDGYTLMVGSAVTNSLIPVLHRPELRFDYNREILPITELAEFPGVVAIRKGNAAESLSGALDRLKRRTGRLVYGSHYLGTYVDINFLRLARTAVIEPELRPATGALAILGDLAAGRTDIAMLSAATAVAHRDELKPLAVTSADRLAGFPTTPTTAEAGYPDVDLENWLGLFAARGTSPDIVQLLYDAAVRAMATKSARQAFATVDARAVTSPSPQAFNQNIRDEMAVWWKMAPDILAIKQVP